MYQTCHVLLFNKTVVSYSKNMNVLTSNASSCLLTVSMSFPIGSSITDI